MDGVRAYWDTVRLISRRGNELHVPDWFIDRIPKIPLDGELWMGRGTFEKLTSLLVPPIHEGNEWNQLGYYLFDLPSSVAPYEERLRGLEELKPLLPSHIHIVENI